MNRGLFVKLTLADTVRLYELGGASPVTSRRIRGVEARTFSMSSLSFSDSEDEAVIVGSADAGLVGSPTGVLVALRPADVALLILLTRPSIPLPLSCPR